MNATTTGYEAAKDIAPGTTIERVYFAPPGTYAPSVGGAEHATYDEALEAAIEHSHDIERRADAAGAPLAVESRIVVDTRWVLRVPPSSQGHASSVDAVAARTTYGARRDAEEHLALIRRYAATPTFGDPTT